MRSWLAIAAAVLCGSIPLSLAQQPPASTLKLGFIPAIVPGTFIFATNEVHRVQIEIDSDGMAMLGRQPREYIKATVRFGGVTYPEVGIHLKGSSGSFRALEDKPAFTLDFDQFNAEQRLDGLSKIHLNNSIEDPSYLNEALGSELFRAAGVPTPRAAHALVELNGRPLGFYVLKEGFTREFLGMHFRRTDGNLYDIGAGNDITERMKRNSGAGPADWSDLRALLAAAQEPELLKRWERLGTVLDRDRFITFMAMEVLLAHRDGYCLARNNFRIYHEPDSGRFVFLPHGMDILFSRAELTLQPRFSGLVATAVMETPEGRRRYRERLALLFTNVLQNAALTNRVDELVANLRPRIPSSDGRALAREAAVVQERIVQRAAFVGRKLSEPETKPTRFENGIAALEGWRIVDPPAGGRLEESRSPDGKPALLIRAGPFTASSWRTKVLLPAGRYRFEGVAGMRGVVPLAFGRNKGAGLRVSVAKTTKPYELVGSAAAHPLTAEFATTKPLEEVELICELRASQGEAWFEKSSLRLVQIK